MKKNKKGFTLLELVIVIAVFAILMAVLIPTFVGIIRRAKLSSDQSTTKNLNTAAYDHEKNEGKSQNIREAIAVAKAQGLNMQGITPTADGAIMLWDSVTDRWILFDVKESKVVYSDKNFDISADVDLWTITDNLTDVTPYSVYLKDNYSGNTTLNVMAGVDVGNNSNIQVINYNHVATTGYVNPVNFYTNGGTLNINAPKDTVHHYGEVGLVDITAIHTDSYHEKGEVAMMKVTQGRVVAEDNSTIRTLYIEGNTTKINIEQEADVTLIAKKEDVTPVEMIVKGEEIIKESEVKVADITEFVVEKTEAQIEKFETASTRYAGGDGTTAYPYLLSKAEHFDVSMREDVEAGTSTGRFYKIIEDIDLGVNFVPIGVASFIVTGPQSVLFDDANSKPFQGSLDGDNHTITLRQDNDNVAALFTAIKYAPYNGSWTWYIKNINMDVDLKSYYNASALVNAVQFGYTNVSLTVENITVRGSILGQSGAAGLFMSINGATNSNVTLRNCTNYANITTTRFNGSNYVICAGIAGTAGIGTKANQVNFYNCRNEGNLICDITDPTYTSKINTSASAYFSIMGHMVGQLSNTGNTTTANAIMRFIGCSYRETAVIEGYSAKDSKRSDFEGLDKSVGKTTYSGTANPNKLLIGGSAAQTVYIGATLDTATEYLRNPSGSTGLHYFAHGGTSAAPGRTSATTANYPN